MLIDSLSQHLWALTTQGRIKIVPENKWAILQGHRNSRKIISYLKSLAFLCEILHFKFWNNLNIILFSCVRVVTVGKVFKIEFKLFFITNNNLSRFFFVTKDVVKVNDNSLFESSSSYIF